MSLSNLPALLQALLPRRLKRTSIFVLLALVFLLFIKLYSTGQKPYDCAVPCKARLADWVFPNSGDKETYLTNLAKDVSTLEEEYNRLLVSQTQQCYDQVHLGPHGDGGWEVCLDRRFDIKQPCLVYSFGIGHDFRFEKGIEELLKCEVHAFDPSMQTSSHKYSEKGHFHDIGIDMRDGTAVGGKWKINKLSTIMDTLGHTGRTLDYLKLDVEFSEWLALYDLLTSGLLASVRQLALEVHSPEMDIHTRPQHVCTWNTKETLAFMHKVMHDLHDLGFRLYYSRINYRTPFASRLSGQDQYCCVNVHFVNTHHELNAWKPHQ